MGLVLGLNELHRGLAMAEGIFSTPSHAPSKLKGQNVVNKGPVLVLNSILFSTKLGEKGLFIPQGRNVRYINITQIPKEKIFPTERPKLLLSYGMLGFLVRDLRI